MSNVVEESHLTAAEAGLSLIAKVFAVVLYMGWMGGVLPFETAVMSIALMACIIASN